MGTMLSAWWNRLFRVETRAEKTDATIRQLTQAVRQLQQQLNQLRGNQ